MRESLQNKINAISFIIICSIFFISHYACADEEERYVPYPIVFISGIGTSNVVGYHSPADTWNYLISSYQDYFADSDGVSKYLDTLSWQFKDGEKPHLEYFSYDSNRGIEENAALFAKYIDQVIARYYPKTYVYTQPCMEPKVIIIAHSMGGIITRYMLTDYANAENMHRKVAFIVFMDVPHDGAPLATIPYIMSRENIMLKSKIAEIKQGRLTQKNILQKLCLLDLEQKMRQKRDGNKKLLDDIGRDILNIDPNKAGLEDLLIPFDDASAYSHLFIGNSLNWEVKEPVFYNYIADQQFLHSLGKNIDVPAYSIIGNDTNMKIREFLSFAAYCLMRDEFSMYDYSCIQHGYYDNGDGVVSVNSQGVLGGNRLEINAAHITSANRLVTTGPYDKPETRDYIFNKLNGKNPIIEKISVCPVDWDDNKNSDDRLSVYVIARVEDYLLADIKIAYLTDDKIPLIGDLANFYDQGELYPYIKFNRDFVKQRDTDSDIKNKDGSNRILYPGEFYVRLDTQGNEQHTVKLKMKNPAGKESEEKTFKFQRPIIDSEKPTGMISGDETRPRIQARIHSPLGVDVDVNSLKMTLDGIDIPRDDLIITDKGFDVTLEYIPSNDLDGSSHAVSVNGADVNGLSAKEKIWTFNDGPTDWEETWDGASYSFVDSRYSEGILYFHLPMSVTGNHTWYGTIHANIEVKACDPGSFGSRSINCNISSNGINCEAEAEAKAIGHLNSCSSFSGVIYILNYDFSPPKKITRISELTWSGGGSAPLVYIWAGDGFGTSIPGTYSLASLEGKTISRISLFCGYAIASASVPFGGGESHEFASGDSHYGTLKITNLQE